jgi:outer membrane murein-binding lipoprotein Lpp
LIGVAEVLIIFAAVIGSSSMVAILAWGHSRLKSLAEQNVSVRMQSDRLADEIEQVREELRAADRKLDRLTERAEFTDRLLSEGRAKPE